MPSQNYKEGKISVAFNKEAEELLIFLKCISIISALSGFSHKWKWKLTEDL